MRYKSMDAKTARAIEKRTPDKSRVSSQITHYCYMDSPIGLFMLAGCERGLRLVSFPNKQDVRKPQPEWKTDKPMFEQALREFSAYFAGDLQVFETPIVLDGGTDFQKQVWQALIDVPYGELASYGDIAKAIQNPGASRAVGGANNANPIPIIVPCHRIIGSNKSLTGFGGGIDTKKYLLDLEARHAVFPDRLL